MPPISPSFGAFLSRERLGGLVDADARAIRAWLASLHDRKLARSSIARKLASVRSCLKYLARRGLVELNAARQIRSPKLPKRLPSFLPKDESKNLLDSEVDRSEAGLQGPRAARAALCDGPARRRVLRARPRRRRQEPGVRARDGQGRQGARGAGRRRGARRARRVATVRGEGRGPALHQSARRADSSTRGVHRIVKRRARAPGSTGA